jgi:similar to spore coat protein
MNEFIQGLMGMGDINDEVIASDFLISAKSGIRNYAFALTETATPELRDTLNKQLSSAIELHERISNYMTSKGYYYPHNINDQLNVDVQTSKTALNIPNP